MSSFKFTDNSDKFIKGMEEAVDRALTAAGTQASSLAKRELQKSPERLDTGLLRNSITYAVSGKAPAISSYRGDRPSKYKKNGIIPSGSYSGTASNDPKDHQAVYVGTNVSYAPYVHEGTSKLKPPNRFLKNAVMDNQAELKAIMENELKKG